MNMDALVHTTFPTGTKVALRIAVEHRMDAVEVVWRFLESISEVTLFQTWTWQKTWFDTVGAARGDRPAIVVIRDCNGAPQGLLPFAIRRRRSYREASWLAEPFLDYGMPLLMPALLDPRVWTGDGTLWRDIMEMLPADVIRLENMPMRVGTATNPLCDALPVEEEPDIAWHCDLTGYDDLASLQAACRQSKGLSKDRRKARRLREIGPVRIATPTTFDEAEMVVDTLYEQKSHQLYNREQASIYDDPNYRNFMLRLWQNPDPSLRVDMRALWVGEEIGATHWSVVHRGRFYYLQPSRHMGEISRYSPGNELLHALLSDCISEKVPVFDFCLGDESYKQQYASGSIHLFRYKEACSGLGRLALAGIAMVRPIRNLIFRLIGREID